MGAVVRVLTEVAPLERPFDYLDGGLALALGDRVRVALGPRSVRGWVVEADVTAPEREPDALRPVSAWLGLGPAPSVLELARWAAWRWCAPWSHFLQTASPARIVRELPVAPAPGASAPDGPPGPWPPAVYHVAPTTDPLDLVLAAHEATRGREGSLLVVVPQEGWAGRLAARLERRGVAVAHDDWARARAGWPVVVGTRAAAFSPVARLAGAVVLDADDDALVSSAAPTWDVTTVVRERCRRDDAPLWATSLFPSPALLGRGGYARDPALVGGWPRVVVVDRRDRDPHEGALAPEVLEAARRALAGGEPVALAVLHQRLGTGRLLACGRCGALVRCPDCGQAESEVEGGLRCASGHGPRGRFCPACSSTALVRVRSGVTVLARDVAAQLGVEVAEVTAARPYDGSARVVVGTEALFGSVRRAGAVCVFDADQYLLAPRAAARRQFVHALGRAGRLVGGRREGRGALYVQTRRGDDPVLEAVAGARFDGLVEEDRAEAELLGLAPYGGEARLSGEGAADLAAELGALGVTVRAAGEGFVARARDVATLCDALAACASRRRCRVAVRGGDGNVVR